MSDREYEFRLSKMRERISEMEGQLDAERAARAEAQHNCAMFCGENEQLLKALGVERFEDALAALVAERVARAEAEAKLPKSPTFDRLRGLLSATMTTEECAIAIEDDTAKRIAEWLDACGDPVAAERVLAGDWRR